MVETHNGAGHNESPKGRHGICSDGLEDRHVVLSILGLNGVGLEVGHDGLLVVHIMMANLVLDLGLEVLVLGSCHAELPPKYGCGGAQVPYIGGGEWQLKYFHRAEDPGSGKVPCAC